MFSKFKEVCIVAIGRSPIISYKNPLFAIDPIALSSEILTSTLLAHRINPNIIDEFYLGNAYSSNLGQNPAKQVINKSKFPDKIVTQTVNKACSSGMLAVILGYMSISQGFQDVVIAGGVETMSNIPLLNSGSKIIEEEKRNLLLYDALKDPFNNIHISEIIEKCAEEYNISRVEMDTFASNSYSKALKA